MIVEKSYTELLHMLTNASLLACWRCGALLENENLSRLEVDTGFAHYYCSFCNASGTVHVDLALLEKEKGIKVALSNEDFFLGIDIIVGGVVVNSKPPEKVEDEGFKDIIQRVVNDTKITCVRCKLPMTLSEITELDIDMKRIKYRCASCGNVGFRSFKSIGIKKDLSKVKPKKDDYTMGVIVKNKNKAINEQKKEDTKAPTTTVCAGGLTTCALGAGTATVAKAAATDTNIDAGATRRAVTAYTNDNYVKCESCKTSVYKSLIRVIDGKNICTTCTTTKKSCPSCNEMKAKYEFVEATDFKVQICTACASKLRKCKKCGKTFTRDLLVKGRCLFCAGEAALPAANLEQPITRDESQDEHGHEQV
jgi:predicted nucleic acid-binding Zn ribbon protein